MEHSDSRNSTNSTSSSASTTIVSNTSSSSSQSMILNWMNPTMRRMVLRCLNVPTAADALPSPLFLLATSGKHSFLALLIFSVAFCALWLPFYLLAYLITEWGVYALFLGTIFFVGRVILRLLAFPGASQRVSGEIEREFAKYSVRMMQSSVSAVVELASAVIKLDGPYENSNLAYLDVANAWKRVQSYRSRVMGVYYNVLAHLYQEPDHVAVYPLKSNATSQLNAFGNNRLNGDVGTLSGITMEAHADGRQLMVLLGKVLSDLTSLEKHGSVLLNNAGRFVPQDAFNERVKQSALALMQSATELSLLLPSLSQNTPSGSEDDRDEDEDVTLDSVRRHLDENNGGSTWGAMTGAMAAILPMLDPAPHKSVFGLDVLRGTVLSRYKGASQMWFSRPTGGKLDAMHIPAHDWDPANGRNRKAVLYCNPNAGLIEVATGISLASGTCSRAKEEVDDACWTDFYTQKGYDVYLFNYCGYGRSHASSSSYNKIRSAGYLGSCSRIFQSAFISFAPSPDTVRADAFAIASCLICELGIESLVIHGESIGGVAAAGAARGLTNKDATKDKVTLLICDRTFTNLQAIAQRLVGSWTAPAISALAPLWNTDVAADFLASTCPKILAQDHADAIIADSGSLKSGIALWSEIRGQASTKNLGWAIEAPVEYRAADWENVGVRESKIAPPTATHIEPPMWPTDQHITLRMGFHFAACVRRVGKLCTQERRANRSRSNTADIEQGVDVDIDGRTLSSQLDESASGLVLAWKSLACCDGLCGAPLGTVVKQGYDWTVTWLCNTLTFGGQIVAEASEKRRGGQRSSKTLHILPEDFDCRPSGYQTDETDEMVHPKPIPEVVATLKRVMERSDLSTRSVEHELSYCIAVLEYVMARVSAAPHVEISREVFHLKSKLGYLLNLHCGHNSQFSVEERLKLTTLVNIAETNRR